MESVENGAVPSFAETLASSFQYSSTMFTTEAEKSRQLETYLLGYPIRTSLAPVLHNTLFTKCSVPWKYSLLESTEQSSLLKLLTEDSTIGAAVTMPHKIAFTANVSTLTPAASTTGAMNTIFFRHSENGHRMCVGTNTDTIGPALMIGGGGAARAAIYALHKWLGITTIYLVNKFVHEIDAIKQFFDASPDWQAKFIHVDNPQAACKLIAPFLAVSTIPDYPAITQDEKNVKSIVQAFLSSSQKGVVLEMCYMPRVLTSFFKLAEENGWTVVSGIEAMLWQGVAQQVLWTESMDVASPQNTKEVLAAIKESIDRIQNYLYERSTDDTRNIA